MCTSPEIKISIWNLHLMSSLVRGGGWVTDLFFEEDITIISSGGFAGVVRVGHDGNA
jgi:hypothetical protein